MTSIDIDRFLDPRIPRATYRLQFHQGFTFADAAKLVPYMADLGLSDVYASPVFTATPGSSHGYDVVDYSQLNPELGGEDEFALLVEALQRHRMGLLIDFVPNHMGIAGGANRWWQDVLENGPASPHATTFDIDWQPLKPELQNQVLLPVLGDQFGTVLERGEIELLFEDGSFRFDYYGLPLPVAPPTYPLILRRLLPTLEEAFEPEDIDFLEFQSIITAFERLAPDDEQDPELIAERLREQIVTKYRLTQVVSNNDAIRTSLNETIEALNGTSDDPRSFDDLEALLNAQAYRPAYWRVASEEINYRRFFAINELAAIRQETQGVFAATHEKLLELVGKGWVTGIRIDHPDGLWDPAGYFRDLQRAVLIARARAEALSSGTEPEALDKLEADLRAELDKLEVVQDGQAARSIYLVVEKILEHGEALPDDWSVHGTVGYEFAAATTGLFVDSANRKAFDELYNRFTGTRIRFSDLVYDMKQVIMRVALASEVNVLARALDRLTEHDRQSRDFTLNSLRNAMREIIACFPVYRTYIVSDGTEVTDRDRRFIERSVAEAIRRNPASDRAAFEFIRDVLLLHWNADRATEEQRDELCQFVMKFQQLTGPVMAKGLEDTAFYIFNRLTSLNEVGGDPSTFGVSIADFHRQVGTRARRWPHMMLTSSTHDTKRSEDVRARISALSEIPREWRAAINRWSRANRRYKTRVEGSLAPSRDDEYLLYQTLVGAWSFDQASPDTEFIDRIESYMLKAIREAQLHSSWINPNEEYEAATSTFVRGLLSGKRSNPFLADFAGFAARIAHIGAITGLSQQLVKLTVPGVPDIYQGTELWDLSLVDPDNRRPVDFDRRHELLAEFTAKPVSVDTAEELLASREDGRIKLYVTRVALACRTEHPDLFREGEYEPLEVEGAKAHHAVAYARSYDDQRLVIVVPRLVGGLIDQPQDVPTGAIWRGTRLVLERGDRGATYQNLFTGETVQAVMDGGRQFLELEHVLEHFPVAMLQQMSDDSQ